MRSSSLVHRFGGPALLGLCILLLLHVAVCEPYHVPTGSMVPALAGRHREAACPRCGFHNLIGCSTDTGCSRGVCQNCGQMLATEVRPTDGDHILVNKFLGWFVLPRRWEIMIFRIFGRDFVKRIVGLPGEVVAILNGDVFINGEIQRKSLADLRAMRVLLFDNNCQPAACGWKDRWFSEQIEQCQVGATLVLDAATTTGSVRLSYKHFDIDERKCRPILDEYFYNGQRPGGEPVFDFLVEGDLRVEAGHGVVNLDVFDGADRMTVALPVGDTSSLEFAQSLTLPAPQQSLQVGRTYRVELALVDRRLTFALDGREEMSLDLPYVAKREPVTSPFALGAQGVRLRVENVRLFRDVHYTQAGRNGVAGQAVQLGVDQYFILGDNSSNSEDSRFWPNRGAVPADRLLGKPIAVYFPSRTLGWQAFGAWQTSVPDWSRLRWLR